MQGGILKNRIVEDSFLIIVGSFIFALGVDCFEIPFGIAAGGVTGLATVIHGFLLNFGIDFPIGLQTILFNIVLVIPVIKSGEIRYIVRTAAGILASGFFVDLLSPYAPALEGYDLFLAVLWGGAIAGLGVGLVFRSGGSTGGFDIVAQQLANRTTLSIGVWSIICNAFVILSSIPVFGIRNALYATVCMLFTGKMIDLVIDGPKSERACYIISSKYKEIAKSIMYEMGRGVTEIYARGAWSGNERPMLFVVLGRSELGFLKAIVAHIDPEAVVIISEVHEAFGEGFSQIGPKGV